MLSSPAFKVNAAFWILGVLNNFIYVLFLAAAEDILTGYAGVILLCTIVPGLCSKMIFSFFADKLPYFARIVAVSVSSAVCSVVVAVAASTYTKLFAIVVYSTIGALGEISFLALTSRYPESVVGAWSSGTGGAGIAGAGAYVFLKDILHIPPKDTLVICSGVPLLMIVIYRLALWHPYNYGLVSSDEEPSSHASKDDVTDLTHHMTRKQFFWTMFPVYMVPLGIVYFAEYTINQGVLGTLTKFTDGKEHPVSSTYALLQFTYQVGAFISRSSIEFIQIRQLWVLGFLQMLNLFFFTACSSFVWLPSLTVAVLLVFWEGLLGGFAYVNVFFRLRKEAPAHLKEWALATAAVADSTGISLAAVVSIWLEQAILNFRGKTGG